MSSNNNFPYEKILKFLNINGDRTIKNFAVLNVNKSEFCGPSADFLNLYFYF